MRRLKVCLLYGKDDPHGNRIRSYGVDVVRPTEEEMDEAIRTADIIAGWPRTEMLPAATNVKWIHLPSAGADRAVRSPLIKERGIIVTNSSGVFGVPIAEHVLGLMLALTRKLHEAIKNQTQGVWRGPEGIGELYGKTVGILGLGDIGTEVARRAKAFGMRVIAVKRRPDEAPPFVDALYGPEGVDRVVAESDCLVLCLPGTESTRHIVSRERIGRMKPGSLLINIGRGSLVDEEALIEALQQGAIGGAGLDVFAKEPLPEDSSLWRLDNVIITPHMSGRHPHHADRSIAIFCRNLEQYLNGEPMDNRVDLEQGY